MPELADKPQMTDFDVHLWNESRYFRAYEKLGAHVCSDNGQEGCHFAVWAPNAEAVSVMGDFNDWNPDTGHPLAFAAEIGVWHGFLPGVQPGSYYKYDIRSRYNGYQTHRADPYAFASEMRPGNASRIWNLDGYEWGDQEWMKRRGELDAREAPISIYEVHLGSWMRSAEDEFLSYRELAPRLAEYASDMGYTHLELLPVTEHPFDGSWGYQVTGYFAPTARYGTPDDFRYFIDTLHQAGIGIILDWVPAHFPKDRFALAFFDGTHLYEHPDPRRGEHPEWGTCIFNYARNEVRNFLISSALFWLDKYHIDGLRVDAVASMLYLDYGRSHGQFLPNKYGGRENIEAITLLKDFNQAIAENYPDTFTLAEESTAWPGVTAPVKDEGLGFTFKWNMGWMNDTLEYFQKEPIHRKHHHGNLTFGMIYQTSEHFMLPLSHDEVVHLKKALLTKMPGDDWQRFANLRVLMGYKMGYPGKKLLFMGSEFGQWSEWSEERSLDWHLLEQAPHRGMKAWVRALNHLYRDEPAMYKLDRDWAGFEWVDCDDAERSLLSFLRHDPDTGVALLFVLNLTPVPREQHRVGVPWEGEWQLILSSDEEQYGGGGTELPQLTHTEKVESHGREDSLAVKLPSLSVLVYRSQRPPQPEGAAAQAEAQPQSEA